MKDDWMKKILAKLTDSSVDSEDLVQCIKQVQLNGSSFCVKDADSIHAVTFRIEQALDNHTGQGSDLHTLLTVLISCIPSELPSDATQAALSTGLISAIGKCFDFFTALEVPEGDESITHCMRCIQDLATQSYIDDGLRISGKINSGRFFISRIMKFLKTRWTVPHLLGRQATSTLLDLVVECRQNQQLLSLEKNSCYLFEQCLASCGDYLMQIDIVEILYRCCITKVISSGSFLRDEARKVFQGIVKKPRKGINLAKEFRCFLIIYNQSLKQCASVHMFHLMAIELDQRIKGIRVADNWISAGFDHLSVNVYLEGDHDTIPPDALDIIYDNIEERWMQKEKNGWKLSLICSEMPRLTDTTLTQHMLNPGPMMTFLLSNEDAKRIVKIIPKLNLPGERASRSSKISWAMTSKTTKADFAADYLTHRQSSNQNEYSARNNLDCHATSEKKRCSRAAKSSDRSIGTLKEDKAHLQECGTQHTFEDDCKKETYVLNETVKAASKTQAMPRNPLLCSRTKSSVHLDSSIKNQGQGKTPRRSPRLAQGNKHETNEVQYPKEVEKNPPTEISSRIQLGRSDIVDKNVSGGRDSTKEQSTQNSETKVKAHHTLPITERDMADFPITQIGSYKTSTDDISQDSAQQNKIPAPEGQDRATGNDIKMVRYISGSGKHLRTYRSKKTRRSLQQPKRSTSKIANDGHTSLNQFLRPSMVVKNRNQEKPEASPNSLNSDNPSTQKKVAGASPTRLDEVLEDKTKPMRRSACNIDNGPSNIPTRHSSQQKDGLAAVVSFSIQNESEATKMETEASEFLGGPSHGPYEFVPAVSSGLCKHPEKKNLRKKKACTAEKASQVDRLEGTRSVGVGTAWEWDREGSTVQQGIRNANLLLEGSRPEEPGILRSMDCNVFESAGTQKYCQLSQIQPSTATTRNSLGPNGRNRNNCGEKGNHVPILWDSELNTPIRKSCIKGFLKHAEGETETKIIDHWHKPERDITPDFAFINHGDDKQESPQLRGVCSSLHKEGAKTTSAFMDTSKMGRLGDSSQLIAGSGIYQPIVESQANQLNILSNITNLVESPEFKIINSGRYGRAKTDTAFRSKLDPRGVGNNSLCLNLPGDERIDPDTEVLENVLKNMVASKQETATKKQRSIMEDVCEKIKNKEKDVQEHIQSTTACLAGHCQQGYNGLAQKLEDIETHIQRLQVSIQTDVDRVSEDTREMEVQLDEARQVFQSLLVKKKKLLKRKIQQMQNENSQLLVTAESKIKKSRAQAKRIPGLEQILKSFAVNTDQ